MPNKKQRSKDTNIGYRLVLDPSAGSSTSPVSHVRTIGATAITVPTMCSKYCVEDRCSSSQESIGKTTGQKDTFSANGGSERKEGEVSASPILRHELPPKLTYERAADGIRIYGDTDHSRQLQLADMEMQKLKQASEIRIQESNNKWKWHYRFAALISAIFCTVYLHSIAAGAVVTASPWLHHSITKWIEAVLKHKQKD